MHRRPMRTALAFALGAVASFVTTRPLAAQLPTGRIVGRVVDRATGQPLSDVGVQLVGTRMGATTGVDGRYAIAAAPAGTITLQARRIGYQAKTVTGLMLPAGGAVEQDVALEAATVQLQAQVVTASAERGTVSEALDQQRNARGIVSAVTAEQIARSPDGDAAQAVQRVSGVTVQDGKYVFVRGLGERYTTTSLDGARIPSPEPEKKVVPLDLFPSSLLQTITTSKTFTPDQPGDFSGASVDIKLREFPLRRSVTYAVSTGFNDAATARALPLAPTTGREWLGFGGGEREMPAVVRAAGDMRGDMARGDINWIVRSFRNAWSPVDERGTPSYSTGFSVGGEDPLFGHRVGYIASGTYSYAQEVRRDEQIADVVRLAPGQPTVQQSRFDGETGRTSVLWGGIVNLSSWMGRRTKLALNNSYNRTADNEAHRDAGVSEEFGAMDRMALDYVERTVESHQLRAEHLLSARQTLRWSLTASRVARDEPDRSDIEYRRDQDLATGALLAPAWFTPQGTERTFNALGEKSLSPSVDYELSLGDPARRTTVKAGALHRHTARDADSRVYDITGTSALTREQRMARPEEIFDGRYAQGEDAIFNVRATGAGGSYRAREDVTAGFGMAEQPLGGRVRLIAGARVERWSLLLDADPSSVGATRSHATYDRTDVLPAAALNVALGSAHTLRLSASQTLSRPEYREVAPVEYRDNVQRRTYVGNASLRRALIQNYDARWEWYPSDGEVLSVGAFAKRFDAPIEQVDIATSGAQKLTFKNAASANNYGVELEARQRLGRLAAPLAPLTAFANATLMKSTIHIGNDTLSTQRNSSRPMVGQAPYVVNAGLTYSSAGGAASATVLYNLVGRRIFAAAIDPSLPDTYDLPRNALDVSLRFPLMGSLSGKLDAKNLLDAAFEQTQGGAVRQRYRVGRAVSLGVSWKD